jgi:hypothetical protein
VCLRRASPPRAGKPLEYFYRHLYLPQQGMFKALPAEETPLGTYHAAPAAPIALGVISEGGKVVGFIKQGVHYRCVCTCGWVCGCGCGWLVAGGPAHAVACR